jgi:hypothetical protein
MRDGPKIAYAASGRIVAYRPYTAGSPEASAYPIPTGTRNAVSTRPATRSWRNQGLR